MSVLYINIIPVIPRYRYYILYVILICFIKNKSICMSVCFFTYKIKSFIQLLFYNTYILHTHTHTNIVLNKNNIRRIIYVYIKIIKI